MKNEKIMPIGKWIEIQKPTKEKMEWEKIKVKLITEKYCIFDFENGTEGATTISDNWRECVA